MDKTANPRRNQITIQLPEEFLALCAQDQVQPETVLRGFIADLCGIINWQSNPRKDGYSSNGSDERLKAQDYYSRVGLAWAKEWEERKM